MQAPQPTGIHVVFLLDTLTGPAELHFVRMDGLDRRMLTSINQARLGTAPWDHHLVIAVLIAQVVERLGEPDGIIAFDPSSFPNEAPTRWG